jgi:sulfate adenylyltransferase subunit 1 (EFTu-like GTPase family)
MFSEKETSGWHYKSHFKSVLDTFCGRRFYQERSKSSIARSGDPIMVVPSHQISKITSIETSDGILDYAISGQSVSICLDTDVDVARGDLLAAPG